MKKMTIGQRITVGFVSVLIISLVLGVFSYTLLITIRNHSGKIVNLSLPAVELVSRLQRNTLECDKLIFKHIGSSTPADMASLEAQMSALSLDNSKVYAELDKILVGDGRDLLEKVKIPRAEYVQV
jgi:uncharacterized membrane protein YkvI